MENLFEFFPRLQNDIEKALTYYASSKQANNDLNVLTCGHEKCHVDKPTQGPRAVAYYTLHYVLSGEGDFIYRGQKYRLKADDIFIIHPSETYTYYQIPENPWEYVWVTFLGLNSEEYLRRCMFTSDSPVYRCESPAIKEAFCALTDVSSFRKSRDVKTLSVLTNILSLLIEERFVAEESAPSARQQYVANAILYIGANYTDPGLNLEQVSAHLGLNKNYVSRLFMDVLSLSFTKYLIILRIQKACHLMQETELNIASIAAQVGYNDPLYFSRLFKQYVGYCPKDYRKYNSVKSARE